MRRASLPFLFVALIVPALALIGFLALPVFGQDEAQERSRFLAFVEEQLSGPGRTIRIEGIEGALSSEASFARITVADDQGVWLTLEDIAIRWNRSALFRGRLEIDTLSAETISWPRMPVPPEGLPPPEAGRFALPELPVAIEIGEVSLADVSLGEPLFGLAAVLSATGSVELADGALDSALAITRLDGPGGDLRLEASYDNASEVLDLDFALSEPADGVVANLLSLEGRPPVALAVEGSGPLDDLSLSVALDADGTRALSGDMVLVAEETGRRFNARLGGPVSRLIAPAFRAFFGDETTLIAQGILPNAGGVELDRLSVESGALRVSGALATQPDGFLSVLQLSAMIERADGLAVTLPVAGGTTRTRRGTLEIDYGLADDGAWRADLAFAGLSNGDVSVDAIRLDLDGEARDIGDPGRRAVSFSGQGAAQGFSSDDPALADALGSQITLDVAGDWRVGAPLMLDDVRLRADSADGALAGAVDEGTFTGDVTVSLQALDALAPLVGQALSGALEMTAAGTVDLLGGGFDLDVSGRGEGLAVGAAPVDALLAPVFTFQGGVARDTEGFAVDRVQLESAHLRAALDGRLASERTDLTVVADVRDVGVLAENASGAAQLSGSVTGTGGPLAIETSIVIADGRLADQAVSDATVRFSGTYDAPALVGAIAGNVTVGTAPVTLAANVTVSPDEQAVSDLALQTDGATVSGALARDPATALLSGSLDLQASNVRTLAALALLEARGSVVARAVLAPDGPRQGLTAEGEAQDLSVNGASVGSAAFDVAVADLFGVPSVTGTVRARTVRSADITVTRLDATSRGDGQFTVTAEGIAVPQLRQAGLGDASLRADGRFRDEIVTLTRAVVRSSALEVSVAGDVAPFTSGGLDLTVEAALPLAFAERFLAERGTQLSGTAQVNAQVAGTLQAPRVTGSLALDGGGLVDPGRALRLSAISARARLDGDAVVVERAGAQIAGGGALSLAGRVGFGDGLPADLTLRLDQARYADGNFIVATANGDLRLSGPLLGGATLGGRIDILDASIQIPSSFASAPGLIDVEHIAPSDRVRATFERARGADRDAQRGDGGPVFGLDITVSAPNQLYVRGRGVDAELGGSVRLGGTTRSIEPVGAFELLRGRIDILGQRIALNEASITLIGDLDPFLNVVARTESDAITVVIQVRGRASDPQVVLTSEPELPQDEVLARLIFDRGLGELSPLQIAQLALAANELAGGSDTSLIGSLRDGLGLSDLDVVTDEAGNPAVRATQYVQENIYLGVEASTDGSARTTINLDVTDTITARGAVGSDGASSVGIFFERDY